MRQRDEETEKKTQSIANLSGVIYLALGHHLSSALHQRLPERALTDCIASKPIRLTYGVSISILLMSSLHCITFRNSTTYATIAKGFVLIFIHSFMHF